MRAPRPTDIPKATGSWRGRAGLALAAIAASVTLPVTGGGQRALSSAQRLAPVPEAISADAEALAALPFAVGEKLTYRVRVSRVGDVGRGTMWVEGPTEVRGIDAWLLRFEFSARVGPVKGEDRTASWLDPLRMAALRFTKRERHPLAKHDEQVELFPELRRWEGTDGTAGASATAAPLDELSFMYYLRTLPLARDARFRVERHFDVARNPTLLHVIGPEVVRTSGGEWRTLLVEMRVRDPRRYRGEGVIWLNVSDDACRLPVRIQSAMPVLGTAVLTLESWTGHARACTAVRETPTTTPSAPPRKIPEGA